MVRGFFTHLNYPSYIVIPLAIAKVLGIVAVLTRLSGWLTEWAYAGFFFDALLALAAHLNAEDGGYIMSGGAIVLILVSRFAYGQVFKRESS